MFHFFCISEKNLDHINVKFLWSYQKFVDSNSVFMASAVMRVGFVCVLLACGAVNCPVTQNTHKGRADIWGTQNYCEVLQ